MTRAEWELLAALPVGDFEILPADAANPYRAANRLRSYLGNVKPFWCWRWSVLVTKDNLVVKKLELKPLALPWTCTEHNHRAIESAAKRSANG